MIAAAALGIVTVGLVPSASAAPSAVTATALTADSPGPAPSATPLATTPLSTTTLSTTTLAATSPAAAGPTTGPGSVAAVPVTAPAPVVTTAQPGTAAAAAVAFALAQRGLPYVWGGNGPANGDTGFDCSGLTTAAYASAGVDLPRTAHTQFYAGPHVPDDAALQPGDLVFYGVPERVHHVGLYLGGGRMVNAPTFGRPVQLAYVRYGGDDYIGATRPAAGRDDTGLIATPKLPVKVPAVPSPAVPPGPTDFPAPPAPDPAPETPTPTPTSSALPLAGPTTGDPATGAPTTGGSATGRPTSSSPATSSPATGTVATARPGAPSGGTSPTGSGTTPPTPTPPTPASPAPARPVPTPTPAATTTPAPARPPATTTARPRATTSPAPKPTAAEPAAAAEPPAAPTRVVLPGGATLALAPATADAAGLPVAPKGAGQGTLIWRPGPGDAWSAVIGLPAKATAPAVGGSVTVTGPDGARTVLTVRSVRTTDAATAKAAARINGAGPRVVLLRTDPTTGKVLVVVAS